MRNAAALEAELRRRVAGEVRFDDGSRGLYATDASNYRQAPIGVVVPRTLEDVEETVATCRRFDAPILARGGGTSLAGQCCNTAVVLDFSKRLNRVIELDPGARLARVQPGVVLDDLRSAAERFHLTFGPDPATHNHCTLGGMIGNNSCGVHSVMAGMTSDNVEELEVLTYRGERMRVGTAGSAELAETGARGDVYRRLRELRDRHAPRIRERFPPIPRRVSGYNLPALLPESGFHVARALVGSECTCALVLEAVVRLVPSPRSRVLLVLGYRDVFAAADAVPDVLQARPIGLEGMDDRLIEDLRRNGLHLGSLSLLPPGRGWLLAEFGGESHDEARQAAAALLQRAGRGDAGPSHRLFSDDEQQRSIWGIRESGLGATAVTAGGKLTWEGWEDSAVPVERLGAYLRELRALLDRRGYQGDFYGHFGQGCVHTRVDFDLRSADGIRAFRAFVAEAAELVVRFGGSLSGEHGDGQARGELLGVMFGPELVQAFREFKAAWDPDGRMNPGKLVDAHPLDANLRLAAAPAAAPDVATRFRYPDDGGSFARASLRCVGVGECRRLGGGTMCPSFRATREEMHSTRGRARLLFEMLAGDVVKDGWRDRHVKQALDLCLSCKGCKGECPVKVDMATYKAEFLAHYYGRRLRPRAAYAMGLVHWWARAAAHAPSLANLLAQTRPFVGIAKALAGVAPQRRLPRLASRTFRGGLRRRRHGAGARALLWCDTFSDHFLPQRAEAALAALEAAGFDVVVTPERLCCGRPLYDWGMLGLAGRLLKRVLASLRDELRAGTPVVVLEPSCLSVFRDEATNLLAGDEDAGRLSRQACTLGELFERYAPDHAWPTLGRRALVHGHCHQKAVIGMDAELKLLRRLGVEAEQPESGCCGMAGAFGFERDKYDVSMRIGELALLPAVRSAAPGTLIVADGFSCREQVGQGAGREALHTAEVLALALRHARP
jgi:FAD/FMN-containing dehydrogenase/Fe-S oxidoreductase